MILIANYRTGSTWVSEYGSRSPGFYNLKYLYGDDYPYGSELFRVDCYENFTSNKKDLEIERGEGREYFIKIMVKQLQNKYAKHFELLEWYKQFYKNTEKIKLYNNNVWQIFLSESYQDFINWEYAHYYEMENYIPAFPYTVDTNIIARFAEKYANYMKFDLYDTLLDFNDLTEEMLSSYFKVDKIDRRHNKINYEENMTNDPIILKNMLHNELKKNGLNINDYVL